MISKETAYRFYIAEGIKLMTQSTASIATAYGFECFSFKKSFSDLFNSSGELQEIPEDTRTAEDVINKIKKGLEGD